MRRHKVNAKQLQEQIGRRVEQGLKRLDGSLRTWSQEHICPAIEPNVVTSLDGNEKQTVFRVTCDIGKDDAAYYVAFDPQSGMFGLVTRLADDRLWYMGAYGEFDEAVKSM